MGVFTDRVEGGEGTDAPRASTGGGRIFRMSEEAVAAKGEAEYSKKLATNKKNFAQGVKRLAESGDVETAYKILSENRGVFTDSELTRLGLKEFADKGQIMRNDKSGVISKGFRLGDSLTGGGLSKALYYSNKPFQSVGLVLGEAMQGDFQEAGSAAVAAVPKPGNWAAPVGYWAGKDTERRISESGLDQDGDRQFGNLREAVGVDMNSGGRLAGAFDLVGSTVLDPTSYISFGSSSVAKAGLKAVARDLGDDVMRQIKQYGLKNAVKKGVIDGVQEEAIKVTIRREAEHLVTSAAKKRSVRRMVAEQGEEGAIDTLTDRSMKEIARSGQSGLRIGVPFGSTGKRTVLPLGRIPGLTAKYPWQVRAAVAAAETVPAESGARFLDDVPDMDVPFDEEAAENALRVAERKAPPAVDSVVEAVPGQFIYRDADGKAVGFLSIADDKVEEIYLSPAARGQGISARMFQAAEDAGIDVSALSADEFTPAGRAAQAAFVAGKSTADAGPDLVHPRDLPGWQPGQALKQGDTEFTVLGQSDDGKDLFVQLEDEAALIQWQRKPKRVSITPGEDGASKAATGGERAGNGTLATVQAGDVIPGVGLVRQKSDDGILRIFPDPDVLPPGSDNWTLRPRVVPDASVSSPEAPALRGGASSQPIRRSAAGVLKDSRLGKALREAFIPRAGVLSAQGETVAQKIYQQVEQATAYAGTGVNDMILQIGNISKQAAKELGDGPGPALLGVMPELAGKTGTEAFNDIALGVLEGTLDLGRVGRALADDEMTNTVKALAAFRDVARMSDEALTASKAAPEAAETLLPQTRSSLPRILTKAGEDIAKGGKQQEVSGLLGIAPKELRAGTDLTSYVDDLAPDVERVSAGQQTLGKDTAALSGKTYGELPVRQLNDEMVKRLGLPEGTKFFEDDAMTAIALRSKSAFEAASQTQVYEGLAKEMAADGKSPLLAILRHDATKVQKASFARQVEENGWKELDSSRPPAVGKVFGPPEIVDDLSKVQDLMLNDDSLRRMQDFLTKWNGVWASYATVPIVFGTGFHSRNSIGNQILSFMGGLTNPARIVEGADIQWGVARTRALMKKEGISWDEALPQAVKSERKRALITDMRKHGIISNGFFADLSSDEVDNVLRHNSLKDWMKPSKIPARLADNKLIRSGRRVGDVVENNARVALYLDAYGKMGNVQTAADHVKKYLFDYGDLTPFERRYMKSLNRFYTFARKNLAVQLHTLAMDPWRIKTAVNLEQQLYNGAATEDAALPEYARRAGFSISGALGAPKGTEGVAMNIDTPLDNAIKTLDPIAQAASMIPGFRNVVPEQYRSDKGQLAKSVLNLRAGGPVEALNFLYEMGTGKDTFSGKDISDEGAGDTFKRMTAIIAPLYSKGANFRERPVWDNDLGMTTRLSLLQALVGVQVLPITDKQKNQIAYVGAQEVENALASLRDEGIDVPTYSELVAAGLAPSMTAPKKGATEKVWNGYAWTTEEVRSRATPEEAADARLDKINAARTALGADPVRVRPSEAATAPSRKSGGVFTSRA